MSSGAASAGLAAGDALGEGSALTRVEKASLAVRLTAAALAGGLLLLSVAIEWSDPRQAEVSRLLDGLAALLVGIPVFVNAWRGLRAPRLESVADLLVSVALLAAWVAGDLRTAAIVPLAMVLGHVLEERSIMGSREAVEALERFTRALARRRLPDGTEEEVPSADLRPGDRLLVRPGDALAADGLVREGVSSLDTSPITGESVPRDVAPGDRVRAGTVNLHGLLEVEVTETGSETTLGKVVDLLMEAERSKPPVTRVLERHAGMYLPLVVVVSLITFFVTGDVRTMMAVLVVSCPCALAISVPATAIAGLAVASRHGILVKGTAFLEQVAEADSVVLDKTGTVTLGRLEVADRVPAPGVPAEELARLAGTLGAGSVHPVSRALASIIDPAERLVAEDLREEQGLGVIATVDGETALLGRRRHLADRGVELPGEPAHEGPVVHCAYAGRYAGAILLRDRPRGEASAALRELRDLGCDRQLLVTGDRAALAEQVGAALGVDAVRAEVLPRDKMDVVREEIAAGRRPIVVGDGVNDALALRAGSVGVAMGAGGSDVALASADIVLLTADLRRLGTMVRLGRSCRFTIGLNIVIALSWTLLMVVLALTGVVGPVLAALLHNVGTLAVLANAGRLLGFDEPLASPDAGQASDRPMRLSQR